MNFFSWLLHFLNFDICDNFLLIFFIVAYCAKIPGTRPPAVQCPNKLCKGRADGNYEYYYGRYNPHYFLQCSNGLAFCQACWPLKNEFSEPCNQCLYKREDCPIKKKATTTSAPDFSGNIADP